ncbi:MAG: tRNA-intron lyase [Halobacteriales archaeon SW_9_67_25]|nr:MAG: tRNA-intron lyase [Halobacteriales archaeon SW_9_67_25]
MEATYDGDAVRAGRAGREQFYDARGYGRPVDGDVHLAPVEAAHLLFQGDLDAVVDGEGDRLGFRGFLASAAVSEVAFFVYRDLRDRGFYLSPAYRVRAVGERADVPAATLSGLAGRGEGTGVLAVVDEESELTYFAVEAPTLTGSSYRDVPEVTGELVADRVLVPDPPETLHGRAFYGQRLDEDGTVQLSLVEAASLAGRGGLGLAGRADAERALLDRGREVEGERFDRRLQVYDALRTAGIVPKTGYKFGADFRTYAHVESVADLGHSERLVRVLPADHTFAPRDLALDVRLAHGVRKEMTVALVDGGVEWLSVTRLTP